MMTMTMTTIMSMEMSHDAHDDDNYVDGDVPKMLQDRPRCSQDGPKIDQDGQR